MKRFASGTHPHAVCGALCALLFLVVMYAFGRLPNIDTDEVFYKAAGRELAMTGRFAAPELSGVLGVDPPAQEVWLLYPPLYPLLFGGVVKLFGFGWMQCVMYDACIKVLLASVTWGVTWRLSASGARWSAFCGGISVLLMARGVTGLPRRIGVGDGHGRHTAARSTRSRHATDVQGSRGFRILLWFVRRYERGCGHRSRLRRSRILRRSRWWS